MLRLYLVTTERSKYWHITQNVVSPVWGLCDTRLPSFHVDTDDTLCPMWYLLEHLDKLTDPLRGKPICPECLLEFHVMDLHLAKLVINTGDRPLWWSEKAAERVRDYS